MNSPGQLNKVVEGILLITSIYVDELESNMMRFVHVDLKRRRTSLNHLTQFGKIPETPKKNIIVRP